MKSVRPGDGPTRLAHRLARNVVGPQRREGGILPGSGDAAWKRTGISLDARFDGNLLNRSSHGALQARHGSFSPAVVENPRSWSQWSASVGNGAHVALHVLARKRVKHAWTWLTATVLFRTLVAVFEDAETIGSDRLQESQIARRADIGMHRMAAEDARKALSLATSPVPLETAVAALRRLQGTRPDSRANAR